MQALTLTGPGGIGKTRLAIEAALRLAKDPACPFCKEIYFVNLAAITQEEFLITAIANSLSLPLLAEPEQRIQQLANYLKPKRLLLLLDNIEHLISPQTIQLLLDMLAHAPQVKLLVTSRVRLNAHLEQVYFANGPGYSTPGDRDSQPTCENLVADYSAIQLFSLRARRLQPNFAITSGNLPAVVQICQSVEGMPLAIELAAAWTEMLAPAEIASEIARSLDFLAVNWPDRPERHHSLRAVFDSSWKLLADPESCCAFNEADCFCGQFFAPGGSVRDRCFNSPADDPAAEVLAANPEQRALPNSRNAPPVCQGQAAGRPQRLAYHHATLQHLLCRLSRGSRYKDKGLARGKHTCDCPRIH